MVRYSEDLKILLRLVLFHLDGTWLPVAVNIWYNVDLLNGLGGCRPFGKVEANPIFPGWIFVGQAHGAA